MKRILLEENQHRAEVLSFQFQEQKIPPYRVYEIEKNGNRLVRVLFRFLMGSAVRLGETRTLLRKSRFMDNLVIYPSIEEGDSGFEMVLKKDVPQQIQVEEKASSLQILLSK